MADISVEKKKGGDLSWLWAAAAIIATLGLMFWLWQAQSNLPSVTTATDADTTEVEAAAPAGETVELTAVGATPDQFAGRQIRVEGVPVAVVLGNRAFWADVTGANPVLVVLGAAVPDVSWLEVGSTVTLEGTVEPVTPEAIDSWIQGQSLQADARDQAAFATHYINATSAQP